MILLDTHTLVWWTHAPEKLSDTAREACRNIPENGGLTSSISLWEVGLKIQRNQIDLGLPVRDYASRLERLAGFRILPVDTVTWLDSLDLAWDHRDPADRIIVATARRHQARLITQDQEIHRHFPGLALW